MRRRLQSSFGVLVALALATACSSQKPQTAPVDGGGPRDTGLHRPDGGVSRDGSPPDGRAEDSGVAPPLKLPAPTANITWAATTTFIDETHTSLVKSVDSTTGAITLDSKGVKSAGLNLSDGRIVVIYGQVMRSITSSTDDGTTLTLQTSTTSLDLAATSAVLDWQQATELSPTAAMAAMKTSAHRHLLRPSLDISGNALTFEGEVGEYSYEVEMTLMGDSADVTVTISKTLSKGIGFKWSAKGTMARFVDHHHVEISGGAVQSYETDNKNVKGSLTFTAVAAASGEDMYTWTMPVPLFEYETLVGPIPVQMEVSAEFTINAVVPTASSVNVSTTLNFDSNLGFTYSGSWGVTSAVGPFAFTKGAVEQAASPSDVEFSGGIGFPRLSVNLFGESLVGWIQPAYVLGGSYTVFPACLLAQSTYLASCGYSASILGHELGSGSTTLFQENHVLEESGQCGDAGAGGD